VFNRFWRIGTAALLSAALLLAGCTSSKPSGSNAQGGGEGAAKPAENVKLTLWYWAESDAPGANDWMKETIQKYQQAHPNVQVDLVIQSTDTLAATFQAAAAAKSGPDIAMQWATMPVLSQVWAGAVAPLSDYVPQDELKHWLNLNENEYQGKQWAGSLYLIGVPLVYNKDLFKKAGLDPEKPPQTWEDFEKALAALKAKGITPIGMGNKDGYTGAWMFSNLGIQELDSTDELKQAVLSGQDLGNPKFTGWYQRLNDLVKKGYFNNDVASLDLTQGWKLFPSGKVAMSWTTDGNLSQWIKDMGEDKIGIMKTPVFGKGKLSQVFNATQSISLFLTSWSPHKEEAAKFIQYLHDGERLQAWYNRTGVFPADDRFDPNNIKSPVLRRLWDLETHGSQVWLENYIPPDIDGNGDLAAGQVILSKNGGPADAVGIWKRAAEAWKLQHPDEVDNYKNWVTK